MQIDGVSNLIQGKKEYPESTNLFRPMPPSSKLPRTTEFSGHGFTLVEIMVVVVIIGLLATIALPALARAQRSSRVSAFANDIRIGCDALRPKRWKTGGGHWDWNTGVFGFTARLSVHQPTADLATLLLVDQKIDDGDLSTGRFRERSSGYILVLEN